MRTGAWPEEESFLGTNVHPCLVPIQGHFTLIWPTQSLFPSRNDYDGHESLDAETKRGGISGCSSLLDGWIARM